MKVDDVCNEIIEDAKVSIDKVADIFSNDLKMQTMIIMPVGKYLRNVAGNMLLSMIKIMADKEKSENAGDVIFDSIIESLTETINDLETMREEADSLSDEEKQKMIDKFNNARGRND